MIKKFDTVSIAAPFAFEKLCRLSSRINSLSRLHSALQSTKLRFSGGGPHVTVTRTLINTSDGSNFNGSGPLRKQTQGSDNSGLNDHISHVKKSCFSKN